MFELSGRFLMNFISVLKVEILLHSCYFQIRRDYFTDKVTAGPQSRILEGINWDEAQAIRVIYCKFFFAMFWSKFCNVDLEMIVLNLHV